MKRRVGLALSLLALSGLFFLNVPAARAGKGSLATITGSVKDEKGNPLAGAIVSLLKDGANVVIKETKTSNDGRFSAKPILLFMGRKTSRRRLLSRSDCCKRRRLCVRLNLGRTFLKLILIPIAPGNKCPFLTGEQVQARRLTGTTK